MSWGLFGGASVSGCAEDWAGALTDWVEIFGVRSWLALLLHTPPLLEQRRGGVSESNHVNDVLRGCEMCVYYLYKLFRQKL